MRNKGFRRFQLLLLAIVAGLIIWRMTASTESGAGVVVQSDMKEGRLYQQHFEVFSLAPIGISGIASFEDDSPAAALAVYPWIVDRGSDEVIWMPTVASVTRDGVKAIIADSLQIEPGMYTLYYTTLGPSRSSRRGGSFMGLKPHWTNYQDYWNLIVTAAPEMVNPIPRVDKVRSSSGVILDYQPTGRGRRASKMIHVLAETTVQVKGMAAVCNVRCDEVQISKIPDDTIEWALAMSNSSAAGGSSVNRQFEADVLLGPGIYEITFGAGSSQAWDAWTENPPHLPYQWGFQVSTEIEENVRLLDPWNMTEPFVSMLEVGDSELRVSKLETDEALDIVVFGMGEMTSSSDLYDWGWIEKEGSSERIWEMTYSGSVHAGGDESNRKEMSIMRLDPGTYYVKYKTDGSHSFEAFGKRRPDNAHRWGIAVFILNPDAVTPGSVRTEQVVVEERSVSASSSEPSPLESIAEDQFLIRWTSLGNNEDRSENFVLTEETVLVVSALGEISSSTRYDYGRIESRDAREIIWEMTYNNTTSAGGDDSYRHIVSELTLPAGTYQVFFETDSGVAYGSSLESGLAHPEDWGIAIFRPEQ